MTALIPIYAPLVERVQAGEALPTPARREHAIGLPEDCAPPVIFLVSDAAASITGQAIGIGGDRLTLYSHPGELATAHRDGGWSAAEIAREWADSFAPQAQSSGIELQPLALEPTQT